ncbi:hypothetical protein ACFSHR_15115 [Azotobacter chroococcum]
MLLPWKTTAVSLPCRRAGNTSTSPSSASCTLKPSASGLLSYSDWGSTSRSVASRSAICWSAMVPWVMALPISRSRATTAQISPSDRPW